MNRPDKCPHCGVSWIGELASPSYRAQYGRTHRNRGVFVVDPGLDCVVAVRCPDCNQDTPRQLAEMLAVADPKAFGEPR
jgi:hypothetical protein